MVVGDGEDVVAGFIGGLLDGDLGTCTCGSCLGSGGRSRYGGGGD